jgi:hypothetical protein
MNSGTVNINGGSIMHNIARTQAGGIDNDGIINMNTGSITSNTGRLGVGGVANWYGAEFNMHGGTISSNTVSGNNAGGGVLVFAYSVFIKHGGSITNNSAGSAGGVDVNSFGIFDMFGGTINNNRSTTHSGGAGGGVRVSGLDPALPGIFIMRGGSITGNSASMFEGAGGGVANLPNGWFRNYGGDILGNSANIGGGILNMGHGWVTISGGKMSANEAVLGGGIQNQQAGVLFISDGIIYGIDAPENLQNICQRNTGAAIVSMPNATGVIVALNEEHVPASDTGWNIRLENFTVDVENGNVVQLSISDIPQEYQGRHAIRLLANNGSNDVNIFGGFLLVGDDLSIPPFLFKVTPGDWNFTADFYDVTETNHVGDHIASYTLTKNLIRGLNDLSFDDFISVDNSLDINIDERLMILPDFTQNVFTPAAPAMIIPNNFRMRNITAPDERIQRNIDRVITMRNMLNQQSMAELQLFNNR